MDVGEILKDKLGTEGWFIMTPFRRASIQKSKAPRRGMHRSASMESAESMEDAQLAAQQESDPFRVYLQISRFHTTEDVLKDAATSKGEESSTLVLCWAFLFCCMGFFLPLCWC